MAMNELLEESEIEWLVRNLREELMKDDDSTKDTVVDLKKYFDNFSHLFQRLYPLIKVINRNHGLDTFKYEVTVTFRFNDETHLYLVKNLKYIPGRFDDNFDIVWFYGEKFLDIKQYELEEIDRIGNDLGWPLGIPLEIMMLVEDLKQKKNYAKYYNFARENLLEGKDDFFIIG